MLINPTQLLAESQNHDEIRARVYLAETVDQHVREEARVSAGGGVVQPESQMRRQIVQRPVTWQEQETV